MTLLTPLALSGLLAVPLLVVFYLFRPEPRQRKSTTYFLWKQAVPDSQGGKFAHRLQSNPLFWLQLLLILLLVAYLCRPSFPWTNRVPVSNRVILMIDRSASMNAAGAFARAVDEAGRAVDGMLGFHLTGNTPEIMLIAIDSEPRVLVPFSKDANLLKDTLRSLKPTDATDHLEDLRPFVQSLLKAHKAKIWLFGDHLPENLRLAGVQFSSVADPGDNNVGIVSFTIRGPEPSRGQDKPFVYARVENFSPTAQQRLMRVEKLSGDSPDRTEAVLFEKTVLLAAGSGQTVLEPVSAARFEPDKGTLFRFSLLPVPGDSADVLPTDDEAFTVVEPFRNEEVLVATTPDLKAGFMLRAVAASSGIKVMSTADLLSQPDPPGVDLLLAPPGFRVPSRLKVRSRFLLAPDPAPKQSKVARLELAENGAPLVGDSGVEWNRLSVQLTDLSPLEKGETELLVADGKPALTLSGPAKGVPTLHWRFPLAYSSLPLSTGLPVVVGRFVDQYARNSLVPIPGSVSTSLLFPRPTGESWKGVLTLTPLTQKARRLDSGETVPEDAAGVPPPPQVGLYRLKSAHAPGQPVAVNLFSYPESKLPRDLEDLNFESEEAQDGPTDVKTQVQYREVGEPLLALALLFLLLEAALFLKRRRP